MAEDLTLTLTYPAKKLKLPNFKPKPKFQIFGPTIQKPKKS